MLRHQARRSLSTGRLVLCCLSAHSGVATPLSMLLSGDPSAAAHTSPAVQLAAWELRQYAKAAKNKSSKNAVGSRDAAPEAGGAALQIEEHREEMARAVEHLQHELANIRTGRATPGMLDHLKVDVYGERLPLKAVGSVSVRDPQLLALTLFDPGMVDTVVAAIAASPLQLNPRAEGQEVLVPVPSPTAETLAALGKVCRAEGETAKVSVRHARKAAMEAAKALVSEDERRKEERAVQTMTDEFVSEVDRLVAAKQKDIAAHNS